MATAAHKLDGQQCICGACSCGKHRCKLVAVQSTAPLESVTEYNRTFHSHQLDVKRVRPVYVPTQSGKFQGTSEAHDIFIAHPLPDRVPPHREVYVPSPGAFDGTTSQKNDYKPWPGNHRPDVKPRELNLTLPNSKFEGISTSKADYVQRPVPPRYHHPPAVYTPTEGAFEGQSTQTSDYGWKGTVHTASMKPPPNTVWQTEDRDFKTAAAAAYITHKDVDHKLFKPQPQVLPPTKFEGVSTTAESFVPKQIPIRNRDLGKVQYVPNPAKFEGQSTTADSYIVKPIPYRNRDLGKVPYVPNTAKFEGNSTTADSFMPKPIPTRVSYAPKDWYHPAADDRDFKTEAKSSHDVKHMEACAIKQMDNMGVSADGHTLMASRQSRQ
ncbi:hypothetical protein SmJEL517_g03829 [Synchytrium microbalum]|uniref:Uncharacterized protein n=1 Tax=Synchytrium microbalum TaxID=1806994 RepID=A0A507C6W3_9FUNG|nr:uncharacterized protein SmJEL517_g03829 [Synchytrium microbalum]TPX33215.1 hypothetical protein SmJEL517_g03829 [Synchytrium microbalum]